MKYMMFGLPKEEIFFCALGPLWVLLKVGCSNIATCLGGHKECTICQWKSFGSWCVCMSQLFWSFLLCKLVVASCFDLSFASRRFSKTSLLHHYPCLFSYYAFVAWASTSLWIKLSVVEWGENCKWETLVCFLGHLQWIKNQVIKDITSWAINQNAIGESLEHLQNTHLRNRVEESTITSKVALFFPNFVMLLKW